MRVEKNTVRTFPPCVMFSEMRKPPNLDGGEGGGERGGGRGGREALKVEPVPRLQIPGSPKLFKEVVKLL